MKCEPKREEEKKSVEDAEKQANKEGPTPKTEYVA
jgi:hypothetical protein